MAGDDYKSASGKLTFNPGETEKTISIDILQDALDENDETYTVTLSGASNATLGDASGAGTITDVTVSYPLDLTAQMLEYSGAKK